ncbi:MAG: glycosyltransferase family 4 protein [Parcubacteria group bacterium]
MKIGLVSSHSFVRPGGVKNHILNLQKEYKKKGHVCKIIAPRSINEKNYKKDIILLGTSFKLLVGGSQGDFTFNFTPGAIDHLLKKEKFDLLHFHNFGPITWQILNNPYLAKQTILTWHASLEGANYFKYLPFGKAIVRNVVRNKIDGIIGVAPFNLDVFRGIKIPKAVIPNGIDLEKFNPGAKKIKKFLDGKINILFLGRIEERKGLMYLLKAYRLLHKKFGSEWAALNLRLIVVGRGPLEKESKDFVSENNLKNVVFIGQIVEPPSYYATCDIYCSPAIYGESFGIVLIEAMATEKPVVAFANAGYKIVLSKGKGKKFLAKPRDFRTLAKHLELLIKNPKLRKTIGRWGQKEAQKYSWPKVADKILAFYKLCLAKKRKSGKNK